MNTSEQAREYHGVAILVHRRWWHAIAEAWPEGARAMILTLQAKLRLRIIVAYAPHAYRPIDEKEKFYKHLISKIFSEGSSNGMTIIGADFNARLGSPTNAEETEMMGSHGYAERNPGDETQEVQDRREMFLQTCEANGLVVTNTRFENSNLAKSHSRKVEHLETPRSSMEATK